MGKKRSGHRFLDMQFITATISTTMVLLLLGLVVFFVLSARNLSTYVRENVNFSIVLSDDMNEKDILLLKEDLEGEPFTRQIEYISKSEALKEQTKAMGTNPEEFLGYNPFSASLEVKLKADYANTDSIRWIERSIKQNIHVQDVEYQEELIDAVNKNIRNISMVLLAVAGVLMLISFALINNTIRLMIYAKRFLIYTMKLVGASWSFIRRPFLARNLWMGLLSGLLADGILLAAAMWLLKVDAELQEIITLNIMVIVMAAVLVFGVVLTFLCAYMSINKYLRMKVDNLYYI